MSKEFIDFLENAPRSIKIEDAKSAYQNMSEEYRSFVQEDTFVDFLLGKRISLLWHDYECGGKQAKTTSPMQFAAVRTTLNHEFLDLPKDIYCQLTKDKIPHPEALKITKINPRKSSCIGLPEPVFFREVNSEMLLPGTCVIGYNSIRYDEEVTRFGFWRNLIPVYEREFKNNNSRWDLINVTAAYKALGVKGINWPLSDEGKTSLRLELLAGANGITQENAHNAVDDVLALIEWSKLLKSKHTILWDYLFALRLKDEARKIITSSNTGVVCSVMNSADNDFFSKVIFTGVVPKEKNKCSFVSMSNIEELRNLYRNLFFKDKEKLQFDSDEFNDKVGDVSKLLFSTRQELDDMGLKRPPITSLVVNKCPVYFSSDWIKAHFPEKWSSDDDDNAEKIMMAKDFCNTISNMLSNEFDDKEVDPEIGLYSSGFPSKSDEGNLHKINSSPIEDIFNTEYSWTNPMYGELLFRMKAKLVDSGIGELPSYENEKWKLHCKEVLINPIVFSEKDEIVTLENYQDLDFEGMDDDLRSGFDYWIAEISN